MTLLPPILKTDSTLTPALLRLTLGLVLLPHGLQKAFGLYGGFGFDATMQYFAGLGIPALFGLLAILAETLGALMLLLGAFTRLAALGAGVTLLTAALTVHLPHGFFMNWFANQKGEGVEFFVLAVALSVAVLAQGGGAFSLDALLARRTPAAPLRASAGD